MSRGPGELQTFILRYLHEQGPSTLGAILWAYVSEQPEMQLESAEWNGLHVNRLSKSDYNSIHRAMRGLLDGTRPRVVAEELSFTWPEVVTCYPYQTLIRELKNVRSQILPRLSPSDDDHRGARLDVSNQERHLYRKRFRVNGFSTHKESEDLQDLRRKWTAMRPTILTSLASKWSQPLYGFFSQAEHYFGTWHGPFANIYHRIIPHEPEVSLRDCLAVLAKQDGTSQFLSDLTALVDLAFPPEETSYVRFKAETLYALFDGLSTNRGSPTVELKVGAAMQLAERHWEMIEHLPRQKWRPPTKKKNFSLLDLEPDLDLFSPLLIRILDRDVLRVAKRYSLSK